MENTNEIIISLSTSPNRIYHIEHLIKTMKNQTIRPTKIVLNLPYLFKRTKLTYDNIPDFITNDSIIKINRCEDIGPSTKIIPTIKFASSPETIIISIDDDIEYKENMIEILLKYSNQYPNAVITGESIMKLPNNKAQIIEGYSSVLYKRKFIEDFDYNILLKYPIFCYLADDLIISNHLKKKNIDIIVVGNDKPYKNVNLDYGNGPDALKNGANGISNNNMDNYKKCSNYLKEKDQLYIDL